MKKITFCLALILILFLTSCTTSSNYMILPCLEGLSRAEIEKVLDEYDISYSFEFEYTLIKDDSELDKFISYGSGLKEGSYFNKEKHLKIITTVLHLTGNYAKTLKMDFEYVGKSFINDGVGEVKLLSATDGDTARFKDIITGKTFKVRFLGIDTPETYAGEDPWGLAASRFTKKRLYAANTIVLESEGAIKDTYDRYLAFVWLDGILLNLEVIDEAYSNSTLNSSKYKQIFLTASFAAMATGRRFYGELDPEYDYAKGKFY